MGGRGSLMGSKGWLVWSIDELCQIPLISNQSSICGMCLRNKSDSWRPHLTSCRTDTTAHLSSACFDRSGLGNLHNIRQMLIMLCLIGIHIWSSWTSIHPLSIGYSIQRCWEAGAYPTPLHLHTTQNQSCTFSLWSIVVFVQLDVFPCELPSFENVGFFSFQSYDPGTAKK